MANARTRPTQPGDEKALIEKAKTFLEVARWISTERSVEAPYVDSACAVLCILGGIAAGDSACASAFHEVARGQDHGEACSLLRRVSAGTVTGSKAAKALGDLLAMKDEAQYGTIFFSGMKMKAAFRRVEVLIGFAEAVLSQG